MRRVLECAIAIVIISYTYIMCWEFAVTIPYEFQVYRSIFYGILIFAIVPVCATLRIYSNIISYHLIDVIDDLKLVGERIGSGLSSLTMARIVFVVAVIIFVLLEVIK